MKKLVFLIIVVFVSTANGNAQAIYNDGSQIVSNGSGSYWVVSGGDFTFTSRSVDNLARMNNLTIASGASLTIDSQSFLTVSGAVTNSNSAGTVGLIVNSDATGTASLITTSATGTGAAAAQRWMSTGSWHLVSSPVVQTVSDFLAANVNIPTGSSSSTGMMDYIPTSNSWHDFFASGSGNGNIGAGRGFSMRVGSNSAVTTTGTLQAGTQSVTGLIAGYWNCIGNPYSSAIGLTSSSTTTANFLDVNIANLDPSYVAVYEWDNVLDAYNGQSGHYTIINNTNPPYSDIQQGQAFMVNMKIGATTVSFTPAMQFHAPSLLLKSSKIAWPTIKLLATVSGQTSSTVIAFNSSMTKGLDPSYDAGLLKGGSDLIVYTKLVQDNGIPFAIQALPDNDFSNLAIPVGLDFKTGGEVTFSSENLNLPSDCKVILEDKLTKTFTDLSTGVYKVTLAANTSIMDRFQLHTADPVLNKTPEKLTAYAIRNTEIRVIGAVSKEAIATLYDIHGRVVMVKQLEEANMNTIPLPGLKTGIYMLSVKDNGKQTGFKIMIKD